MCNKCKICSFFSFNYCSKCGANLLEGKIKNNRFLLNGHLYEYANEPIVFDDWFVNIKEKITMIRHHSYSNQQWDSFDTTNFRKIVKTTNPSFVFDNVEKIKK